jgi:hypothetical protein
LTVGSGDAVDEVGAAGRITARSSPMTTMVEAAAASRTTDRDLEFNLIQSPIAVPMLSPAGALPPPSWSPLPIPLVDN